MESSFVRLEYRLTKELKTSIHFGIQEFQSLIYPFTNLIRLEIDQGYSKAKGVDYWLRIRNCNNWKKCDLITGVKPTGLKSVFYGDHKPNGKTLIVFQFSPCKKELVIDYFKSQKSTRLDTLQNYLQTHPFKFPIH